MSKMGPEWRLMEQHCRNLNMAMKACVGVVQIRLEKNSEVAYLRSLD